MEQHVGVTSNHGEQIVEIVCDAACQLTECFHLL